MTGIHEGLWYASQQQNICSSFDIGIHVFHQEELRLQLLLGVKAI